MIKFKLMIIKWLGLDSIEKIENMQHKIAMLEEKDYDIAHMENQIDDFEYQMDNKIDDVKDDITYEYEAHISNAIEEIKEGFEVKLNVKLQEIV